MPRSLTPDMIECCREAAAAFHGTVSGHVAESLGMDHTTARIDYANRVRPLFTAFKKDPTPGGARVFLTAIARDALALMEAKK